MVQVAKDQSLAKRLMGAAGYLLFKFLLPLVHHRGAVRVGSLPLLRQMRIWVNEGPARIQLPPFDFYWGRYLYTGRPYEPEVGAALQLASGVGKALFVDAGANYGYWSARVAAGEFGDHDVVAVEASESTLTLLRSNLSSTEARVVAAAVADQPGYVTFDDGALHVARRITTSESGKLVPAVTLDDIVGSANRTIVKLDVEGAEVAALAGAADLLRRDVCFIYECHGADLQCRATEGMFDAGLAVYSVGDDGTVARIDTVDQIRSMKTDPLKGYNFVAASPGDYERAFGHATRT